LLCLIKNIRKERQVSSKAFTKFEVLPLPASGSLHHALTALNKTL